MVTQHRKGDRRLKLDAQRRKAGEPNGNWKRNRDRNSRFPKDGIAFRNKGRARFKTGKKTKRSRKAA